MKNITISVKKIRHKELEALQEELKAFIIHLNFQLKTDFLNAMISIDISGKLFYKFRNKLEYQKEFYTISFSMSEAATILKCCNYDNPDRSVYTRNVLTKFNLDLDQKLKSI